MKKTNKILTAIVMALTIVCFCQPISASAASAKPIVKASQTVISKGTTTKVKVTYNKKNVTNKAKFKTSNKSVATVSKKGVVTGKKAGTATITAVYKKTKATCKVSVKAEPVKHIWTKKITKQPTCTEDGVKTLTCSCGEVKTEVIQKLGHVWDDGVVTEATCTEDGAKTYTCTRCGEVKSEAIAKLGHVWDDGVITEPTCTVDGAKTYTCETCGETKSEVIKATGHTWDDGVITKEPTDTESGVKTYTCTKCGDTKDENGHYEKQEVAGWDEEVTESVFVCNTCKLEFAPSAYGEGDVGIEAALEALMTHQFEDWDSECEGYHVDSRTIIIHHDPTYEDVWVADK